MRRYITLVFVLLLLLPILGCSSQSAGVTSAPTTSTSTRAETIEDYLAEENGQKFLVLPISRENIKIYDAPAQDLQKIDLEMLKAAEEKISEEISGYSIQQKAFFVEYDGEYVVLCAELIINIDTPVIGTTDPTGPTLGQSGCGIDHDHKFFSERISK